MIIHNIQYRASCRETSHLLFLNRRNLQKPGADGLKLNVTAQIHNRFIGAAEVILREERETSCIVRSGQRNSGPERQFFILSGGTVRQQVHNSSA